MGLFYKIKTYINHYFTSKNAHGIHSPYVFNFYVNILHNPHTYYYFDTLKREQDKLKHNHKEIEVEDFGTGINIQKKKISSIAIQSASQEIVKKVLFELVNLHACNSILELGTSLGLSSAYMAFSRPRAKITSLDGAKYIQEEAQKLHNTLGIKNIKLINGNFDLTLPKALENNIFDLIYFDGNHEKSATLRYFEWCLMHKTENSIFVFDDIYWSNGMTEAWEIIKSHPEVTQSIDMYHCGIIYFSKSFPNQHFKLRN